MRAKRLSAHSFEQTGTELNCKGENHASGKLQVTSKSTQLFIACKICCTHEE